MGALCPGVEVEEIEVAGPPVSPELRGAVWAEVLAARLAADAAAEPAGEGSGRADVSLPEAGRARVEVRLGDGPAGTGRRRGRGPARCSTR